MIDLCADCSRCRALCCVELPFARGADFAITKPAGTPCRHLATDFRCTIHERLPDAGFPGCVAYDCFGAGQRASARPDPAAAFAALRPLHELLWYLYAARRWPGAAPLHADLDAAIERTEALADAATADVAGHRATIAPLLRRAGDLVRGAGGPDHANADLAGRDLRTTDLRGASLRNALLIGADLRGADLHHADVLGADLRAADLRGADVSSALYLTQSQLNAARGDDATRIPATLSRPAWRRP